MTESETAAKNPDQIWELATSIGHRTSLAVARIKGQKELKAEEEGETKPPVFELTPSIGKRSNEHVVIGLRATATFDDHVVKFEEIARVAWAAPLELSVEELKGFATDYVLPFLVPYVEVGFRRMCAEVHEEPPGFPMMVIHGQVYSQDDTDDEEDETASSE